MKMVGPQQLRLWSSIRTDIDISEADTESRTPISIVSNNFYKRSQSNSVGKAEQPAQGQRTRMQRSQELQFQQVVSSACFHHFHITLSQCGQQPGQRGLGRGPVSPGPGASHRLPLSLQHQCHTKNFSIAIV